MNYFKSYISGVLIVFLGWNSIFFGYLAVAEEVQQVIVSEAGLPPEFIEPEKDQKPQKKDDEEIDSEEEPCEETYGFSDTNLDYSLCKIHNLTKRFVRLRGSRSQLLFPKQVNDAAVDKALLDILENGSSGDFNVSNRSKVLEDAKTDAQILAQLIMSQVNKDYDDGGYQTKGNALFNSVLVSLGNSIITDSGTREIMATLFDELNGITEREFQQSYLNQAFLESLDYASDALWVSMGALTVVAFAKRFPKGLEKMTSLELAFRRKPAMGLMRGWYKSVNGVGAALGTAKSKVAEYFLTRPQTVSWKVLLQQFKEVGGRGAALKGMGVKLGKGFGSDFVKFGLLPSGVAAGGSMGWDVLMHKLRGPKANPYEMKRRAYGAAALFLMGDLEDLFRKVNGLYPDLHDELKATVQDLNEISGYSDQKMDTMARAKDLSAKAKDLYRAHRNNLMRLLTQIPEMEESVEELKSHQLIEKLRDAGEYGKSFFNEAYEKAIQGRTHVSLSPLRILAGSTLNMLSNLQIEIQKIDYLTNHELSYLEVKKQESALTKKYAELNKAGRLLEAQKMFRQNYLPKKSLTKEEAIVVKFLLRDVTEEDVQILLGEMRDGQQEFSEFWKQYKP